MAKRDLLAIGIGAMALGSILQDEGVVPGFDVVSSAHAAELLRSHGHSCGDAHLVRFGARDGDSTVRFAGCDGTGYALTIVPERPGAHIQRCDAGAQRRYPVGCTAAREAEGDMRKVLRRASAQRADG